MPVRVCVCDVAMLILRFMLFWLSSNQLPCFFTVGVRESALVHQIILSFAVNVCFENNFCGSFLCVGETKKLILCFDFFF